MSPVLQRVREGFTYAADCNLKVMECPDCGVTYAIPATLQANAYKAGHRKIVWFCPNGHKLGYNGESEAERERDEARAALERARERAAAERDLREHTERQLAAQKGATTRAKKRAAAAVCPVEGCGRSFVQLRRHMAAKHPEYKPNAS
jgi:hypothetical protein